MFVGFFTAYFLKLLSLSILIIPLEIPKKSSFFERNFSTNISFAALMIIEDEGYWFIFCLILISGNFLAETLGCQFQKLLDNMIFKNLMILHLVKKKHIMLQEL